MSEASRYLYEALGVDAAQARAYGRLMTTILSATGGLEVPEVFRKADGLHAGQRCEIERVGQGEYHLRVDDGKPRSKESWVKILRECPVKDWWEPLDHSNLLITRDNTRLFEDEGEDES